MSFPIGYSFVSAQFPDRSIVMVGETAGLPSLLFEGHGLCSGGKLRKLQRSSSSQVSAMALRADGWAELFSAEKRLTLLIAQSLGDLQG